MEEVEHESTVLGQLLASPEEHLSDVILEELAVKKPEHGPPDKG